MIAAAGKTLWIDKPGTYLTGSLNPANNTTVEFTPGVVLAKKLNGVGVLNFEIKQDITINARDGFVDGTDLPGTSGSLNHTVAMLGSKRIKLNSLNVIGSALGGGGKDGIYLGVHGDDPCEDIEINGGSANYAKRNGLSIVGALRTRVRGTEFAYNTGAPGAGVDVEANDYGHVDDVLLENCHFHHNQQAGFVNALGTNCRIKGGSSHHNGAYGVAVTSGSAGFFPAVARKYKDVWGIVGFDQATGVITLGGDLIELPVGTPLRFNYRGAGALPAAFNRDAYIVSRHVGTNGIVLGSSEGFAEITSATGGFIGVLDPDWLIAEVWIEAFVHGQSNGFSVEDHDAYENGNYGISLVGAGLYEVVNCRVYDNARTQISALYSKNIKIIGNKVYQTALTSNRKVAGIDAEVGGGYLELLNNEVSDTLGVGTIVANWVGAVVEDNLIDNCGAEDISGYAAGMAIDALKGASVKRNKIKQDAGNTTTLYGLRMTATATQSDVTDNDCTNAGTTNANSILIVSGTNTKANNRQRDGTLRP